MLSLIQLPYRKHVVVHKPRELGPVVVGIALGLILLVQLALVLWLHFSHGRH